jgi:hypothetical protein
VLKARQVVLHDLKGIVTIPVAVLGVENLDFRILLHDGLKTFHAFVIDRCRNAPKHHNVPLTIEETD